MPVAIFSAGVSRDGKQVSLQNHDINSGSGSGLSLTELRKYEDISSKECTYKLFDITSKADEVLPKPFTDWLWNNCFNSWRLIEFEPDILIELFDKHEPRRLFVLFDAESDAIKFEQFLSLYFDGSVILD